MGPIRTTATLVVTAVALAAVGCAPLTSRLGPAAQQNVSTVGMPGAIEPIHAAALLNNVAVFWVSSNGCTARDDLRPMVSTQGDASVITLRRIAEDSCKTPLDDGVEVMWSFEELGIKPGSRVTVNNPYQLPHT